MVAKAHEPKFDPGRLVATPGALAAFTRNGQTPLPYLARHARGDWGDVDAHDKKANDRDIIDGGRLLSAYTLNDGTKIWVLTEAAGGDGRRASKCVLLPGEY